MSHFVCEFAPDNTASHALLIGAVLGLCIPAIGLIFKYPIFKALGTPPEILEAAVTYFRIIVFSFVFTNFNVQFRAILTGEGNTRTPILFQVGGTLLNIVLDPQLIYTAGLVLVIAVTERLYGLLIVNI